ncbi:hypothetical protein [Paracoccus aerius]|uniref:Uncharacterized protein n=1 Tax=Paracoccus aerius TaxID=1915382 RepID=A0ABS1S6P7_9RHOB|nr:hypothetical protein [Paracoccus aerius]MBL3674389.1 hypothetical protein [Paracoccus aerius]GHG25245.1 hypothetical protein GCM10017322_24310 [Paracoccus aerius]
MKTSQRQSRNNQYYLDRLARERPDIHADLQSGKIPSTAKALDLAGIKPQRTPLQLLEAAWKKASAAEKTAFKGQIGCSAPSPNAGFISPSSAPIHVDRRLTPATLAEVQRIMSARGLKMGHVMAELGFSRLNVSLGSALSRGWKVSQEMIDALEPWLRHNAAVGR